MRQGAYSYRHDPAVPSFSDDRPVVLFDGDCVLCSYSARTLLKHGPRFCLLPMQSDLGRALLVHYGLNPYDPASMLVIEDGRAMGMSDAVLYLARHLPFPYRLGVIGYGVPRPIRDAAYRFVARNRRRLSGKTWCAMPPQGVDMKGRILG